MSEATLIPNTPSTLPSWGLLIAKALESYGVKPEPIFAAAGIDLAEAHEANSRIPVHKMAKVWRAAVELTGDSAFALRLTRFFQFNAYSALGMAVASSRSIAEGLQRCVRYYRLMSDGATLYLQDFPERGRTDLVFELSGSYPEVTKQAMEAFSATSIELLRITAGPQFSPLKVCFAHSQSNVQAYVDYFKCPVMFNCPDHRMVFDREQIQQELVFNNSAVAASLDTWMADYLQQFRQDLVSTRVQAYLLEHIVDGEVEQKTVATELGMSVRALQRKLQDEETSFSALLDNCRQHLAREYLSRAQLPLAEVSFMLGFSDQSNFSRAFKRWTGHSPQAYRDAQQGK
ncbi:MAG: AraC family transcriptional regulator [Cellvibrionaceae bacterium]|nr:AraC family transcriptional regulator [Cellvibrionaceae bacterium]